MKNTKTSSNPTAATVALSIAGLAILIAVAVWGNQTGAASPTATDSERIDRGKYLVTIGGCNDCHTPWKVGEKGPEPDMSRMLSGHPQDFVMPPAPESNGSPWMMTAAATNTAWAGPWGVSFTANLTPDEDTGIGAWSEDIFIATLRTGKHWGQSRQILPPMPWFNYGKMSDDDLKAVYAYLRSIPPVKNRVPTPLPPGGEVAKSVWD